MDIKKQEKRVKEPLSNCEIVNGGRILEQAINEQNTRILRIIQHQDCVALEVKYHATCYLNYTRPLTRKGNKQQHDRHYTESFKKFCKDVVEEKLIKEEKAWELVALKKKFVQVVAEVEKVDASSYKTNSLKGRLQSTYPSLRFARPKNPNESDIVYAKQLSAETLFANSRASVDGPSGTDTSTDSEEDEGFVLQRSRATGSTLTELYNSALDLKKEIEDIPTQTMPWPPDSRHLTLDTAEKIVPTKLYNFLSWMDGEDCGVSEGTRTREWLLLFRLVGLLGDLSRGDLLDERGDHREPLGELVEVWENLSLSLGQILETINIFKTMIAFLIWASLLKLLCFLLIFFRKIDNLFLIGHIPLTKVPRKKNES